jgi:hypothetical protein
VRGASGRTFGRLGGVAANCILIWLQAWPTLYGSLARARRAAPPCKEPMGLRSSRPLGGPS